MAKQQTEFTTYEVCARLGLTYRMVSYWAAQSSILRSSIGGRGSGNHRRYSMADLERVAKAAALAKAAVPLLGQSTGIMVGQLERFVREATLNSVGDWVWECDDFTLIIAGSPVIIEDGRRLA